MKETKKMELQHNQVSRLDQLTIYKAVLVEVGSLLSSLIALLVESICQSCKEMCWSFCFYLHAMNLFSVFCRAIYISSSFYFPSYN